MAHRPIITPTSARNGPSTTMTLKNVRLMEAKTARSTDAAVTPPPSLGSSSRESMAYDFPRIRRVAQRIGDLLLPLAFRQPHAEVLLVVGKDVPLLALLHLSKGTFQLEEKPFPVHATSSVPIREFTPLMKRFHSSRSSAWYSRPFCVIW